MEANNTVNQVVATSVNCCGMCSRQADNALLCKHVIANKLM